MFRVWQIGYGLGMGLAQIGLLETVPLCLASVSNVAYNAGLLDILVIDIVGEGLGLGSGKYGDCRGWVGL